MPPRVTIALPAFNEAENIVAALDDALAVLRQIPLSAEILVVDDGSTDDTSALVASRAATVSDIDIRTVRHAVNRRFSGAIRSCLEAARGDFVLLLPADRQVRADVLFDFVRVSEEADIVVGIRSRRADPPHRTLLSFGFHFLARTLLGIPLSQFSSSFLFRRSALDGLTLSSRPRSAAILPEILARARRRGARFREVLIAHHPRIAGRAKGDDLRVALFSFVELLRLAIRIRLSERP